MWLRLLTLLLSYFCNLIVARTDAEYSSIATEHVVGHSFSDREARVGVLHVIAHTAKVGFDTFAWTLIPAVTILLAIPILIVCLAPGDDHTDTDDHSDETNKTAQWDVAYQKSTPPATLKSMPGSASALLLKSPNLPDPRSPSFGRCSPVMTAGASPLRVFGGQLVPLLRNDSDDSTRTESGTSSPTEFFSSELTLCPELVVQQPGGVTLKMHGLCAPFKQSEVLEVRRSDSVGNMNLMARAIISEYSNGGGVVLESASHCPLVFVSTDRAVAKKGALPPIDRYVTVSPISTVSSCSATPTLFTIKAEGANEGYVMWRGAAPGEDMLLAVRVHGDGRVANVVDKEGKLLAATETRESNGASGGPLRLLHIASGVDAGLIIIAIIAAQKLS